MSEKPVHLCDPSRFVAAAAFIFIVGMLFVSCAMMVVSGVVLVFSFVIGAFMHVKRKH